MSRRLKVVLGIVGLVAVAILLGLIFGSAGKNNDYQYYIDRKKNTGDLHGEAPLLWTASAFLR